MTGTTLDFNNNCKLIFGDCFKIPKKGTNELDYSKRESITGSRRYCTLKPNFLQVNLFSLFFLGISYICTILYPNFSALFFRAYSTSNFLAFIEKLAYMLIGSLRTFTQFINKLPGATIDNIINFSQTK